VLFYDLPASGKMMPEILPKKIIPRFKVIFIFIRLHQYMDELITLPMALQQQSILYAVQNYRKRLFAFIRRRVKTDEDAEDILQDVWYQLSSIIDTEPIGQLSSWLYRVSRNRIADKKRKQGTLALEDLAYQDEDGELVLPDALLADTTDPLSEMEKEYFKDIFFTALNELPQKQRDVFVWNEMEDMTLREIADQKGENLKTIISRKGYAVKHLRNKLNYLYEELNM
jgi:RNA polymerase sigma factor (sigma-70 family)